MTNWRRARVASTLYGKLVVALFALVMLISLIYVVLTVTTTRLYLQEVNQKLNQALAANIVADTPLLQGGKVNRTAFEGLFHSLMVINPGIELYLIDPEGVILSFNAPPGRVKRDRISLAPVRAFITGAEAFPIRGDDPRDPQGRKVFSAAELREGDRVAGYLYVVLGGEAFDSVARMIQDSYILRLGIGVGLASLALALIAGLVSFNWLTRRLRRLSAAVDAFKHSEFEAAVDLGQWRRGPGGDEIDALGLTVEQMSRRIVDQIRQLHHADAARREMIANISHDLRTPLTSLQGYLETLLIKESALSETERRHYLDLAAKHGKRLGQLTTELFELAMLEGQGTELQFEPFSLAELVQDVAQKFELEAEKHGLTLETEIPAGAPFVSGDIALIARVLENLIENAIKYTPAGGRVRIALVPGSERISARVSDTGVGIPEHEIPHIFERFYRVEKSRGEGPEGTGLGLAIAHRILDLHGGLITVESKPGDGASFTFDLPIAA
jgi:signal transduction histidine kinase